MALIGLAIACNTNTILQKNMEVALKKEQERNRQNELETNNYTNLLKNTKIKSVDKKITIDERMRYFISEQSYKEGTFEWTIGIGYTSKPYEIYFSETERDDIILLLKRAGMWTESDSGKTLKIEHYITIDPGYKCEGRYNFKFDNQSDLWVKKAHDSIYVNNASVYDNCIKETFYKIIDISQNTIYSERKVRFKNEVVDFIHIK